jgi:hypothetical protein
LVQIEPAVFEHKIHIAVNVASYHVFERNNVLVKVQSFSILAFLQLGQNADLANACQREAVLFLVELELLNCDELFCDAVDSLVDDSIRSAPDFLESAVFPY